MNLLHGVGDFFSLDIGTNSLRVVQLSGDSQRGWSLSKYAYAPIDAKLLQDSSDLGKRKLGETIMLAVQKAGIKTRNIAIGLPSNKTYTSVVDTDTMPAEEIEKAFRYEMDKYVPMPMSEARADYLVLGPNPIDPSKTEVMVSSTAKEYAETQLEIIEKAGFNVIAMEPEPLAIARALAPKTSSDAVMIVDFGERSTDLIITYQNHPRLVRAMPNGFAVLVKTVASALNVREDQARQFILKFGLEQEKVEGQVFKVLDSILSSFAAELSKSVQFFQTRYAGVKVGGIILSGYAQTIPLFPEYIEAKTGLSVTRGNPWQYVRMSAQQQQELINVTSEFPVAIGLAERSNE